MGDVSIIARRLSDQHVQYGWSGNGGYFKTVGLRLLHWYNDPNAVEYLFGLGQLRHLWEPHSETTDFIFRTEPDGTPHWVGTSERSIFSRIAFIVYGYFYDTDHTWYYVKPGPFRIKLPATLVAANLDENGFEFSFLEKVDHRILDELFSERYASCLEHSGYDQEALQKAHDALSREKYPLEDLWDHYIPIFKCFDDWVVVRPDDNGDAIREILLRPKTDVHTETIFW